MTQSGEVRDPALVVVCRALSAHGADYVLFGAMAMQLWGYVRATRDIDILIPRDAGNAGRVLTALSELGYGLAREWMAEDLVRKPITVIGDDPRVDVMTVAWNVQYADARAQSRNISVNGVVIPVASIEHLIQSKRTGRLRDAADIEVLEELRNRL